MTKLVIEKTKIVLSNNETKSEDSSPSSSEEARLKLLDTVWRFLVLQDKRKRYKQFLDAPKVDLTKAHIFELINLAINIFKQEETLIEIDCFHKIKAFICEKECFKRTKVENNYSFTYFFEASHHVGLKVTMVEAPFIIFADIHGQYLDLLDILDRVGWPPKRRFLFTGDYVDRGPQSLEVIVLLLYLKVLFPQDVYLLRGNHESSAINSTFGFRLYDVATWAEFQNCFNHLSIMALVSSKIICMHGGISPSMESFDDVNLLLKPFEVPNEGLGCDLVWADPCPVTYDDAKGYLPNETRKTSFYYCQDAVDEFLSKFDLDVIVRGHELVNMGYEYRFEKKCLTIFTAPQYCGWYNDAAILNVDQDLTCQVITFTFKRKPPALTENQRKMFEAVKKRAGGAPFEPWTEKTIKDDITTDNAAVLPPLPTSDGTLDLKNLDKAGSLPETKECCAAKIDPSTTSSKTTGTDSKDKKCCLM